MSFLPILSFKAHSSENRPLAGVIRDLIMKPHSYLSRGESQRRESHELQAIVVSIDTGIEPSN